MTDLDDQKTSQLIDAYRKQLGPIFRARLAVGNRAGLERISFDEPATNDLKSPPTVIEVEDPVNR